MKKTLLSLVAGLFLVFSAAANAAVISATGDSGVKGGKVYIPVTFDDGDYSLGGEFSIGFESEKLKLIEIFNDAPNYPSTSEEDFILTFNRTQMFVSLSNYYFTEYTGPLFTLQFEILVFGPGTTDVTISDYFSIDDNGVRFGFWKDIVEDPLADELATITINPSTDGTIPEPGALALVGLALLIMTGVGRRNRMNCG